MEQNRGDKPSKSEIAIFFLVTFGMSLFWGIIMYLGIYKNSYNISMFMMLVPAAGVALGKIHTKSSLDKWKRMERNALYGAAAALVYSLLVGYGYFMAEKNWLDWVFWSVFLMIFLMYISVTTVVETRYRSSYTKYSGIVTAINTVNFLAVLISAQGRTKSWRRDGREFH